jgi:glycosyltransferase involved in cell wall biosynthesis
MRNVEMVGFVSGEAKWDVLRSTLAIVVPSEWYEMSPFSVIESLATGVAVVASNLGNFPAAISDHETGMLFRSGDSQDLSEKLAWLAEHPENALAMGRRAREVAEARYSASAHYDQLLGIYRALAGSPRAGLESRT